MSTPRALHYVLKIGHRKNSINFFKDVLGMKVLRHEEFREGCEATCNGPYDGRWSKTMIGFGSEDDNFVLELTYNYGIPNYGKGNSLLCIDLIKSDMEEIERLRPESDVSSTLYNLESPCGYSFNICSSTGDNAITTVKLASTDLEKSKKFWCEVLGMTLLEPKSPHSILIGLNHQQFKLEFMQSELTRGENFGRIAFAIPEEDLEELQEKVDVSELGKVQTRKLTLPTEGKADVVVIILQDPDLHEICFVGEKGFKELSKIDPNAEELLSQAIADDKSEAIRKAKNSK